MTGLNYSDSEPRIYVASGERVTIALRHRDHEGPYLDIVFSDGRAKRVHPSRVRPLTFLELLEWRRGVLTTKGSL